MSWLKNFLHATLDLFVDGVWFALAILLWLLLVWMLRPCIPLPAPWQGIILFSGLACILVGSVLHQGLQGPKH